MNNESNIFWKLIAIALSSIALISASPFLVSFIDIFYWFWTNTTWTGLTYSGPEGGIRFAAMCILLIPAIVCGIFASIILGALQEDKRMKELRKKIDTENNIE